MQDFRLGKSTTASQATRAPMNDDSVVSINKSLLSIDYASESPSNATHLEAYCPP
jgi:hypothetical protein